MCFFTSIMRNKMTNNNRDVLKATILKKLKRRGKWGGAHTSFDRLTTGIPKHLKGETKNVLERFNQIRFIVLETDILSIRDIS